MNGLSNYITEMLCKEVKHEPVIYDGCNSLLGRDKRNSILSDWRIAEIVSKGAAQARIWGQPTPFDTPW